MIARKKCFVVYSNFYCVWASHREWTPREFIRAIRQHPQFVVEHEGSGVGFDQIPAYFAFFVLDVLPNLLFCLPILLFVVPIFLLTLELGNLNRAI